MSITSDTLADILRTLREANSAYNMAVAGQKEAEDLETDLNHDLELEELSYHARAHVAKQLQTVLRDRRTNKDATELLEPLHTWYQQNQEVVKSLERVLGTMRRVEEKHTNRQYTRRYNPALGVDAALTGKK